jgi:hypothetical protein
MLIWASPILAFLKQLKASVRSMPSWGGPTMFNVVGAGLVLIGAGALFLGAYFANR